MAIVAVMTHPSEASFGYHDYERRSSIGSLVLTPTPSEGVSARPMQPATLAFPDSDLLDGTMEDP